MTSEIRPPSRPPGDYLLRDENDEPIMQLVERDAMGRFRRSYYGFIWKSDADLASKDELSSDELEELTRMADEVDEVHLVEQAGHGVRYPWDRP